MLTPRLPGLLLGAASVTAKDAVKLMPDLTSCQLPLPLFSDGFHQESEPVPLTLPAPPLVSTYREIVPASCHWLSDSVNVPVYDGGFECATGFAASENITLPAPARLYQPLPLAVLPAAPTVSVAVAVELAQSPFV